MLHTIFLDRKFQATGCRQLTQKLQSLHAIASQPSLFSMANSTILAHPAYNLQSVRFATKKAGGSVRNGRDSIGKRLGVKKLGGQKVQPGTIIIRQRGTTYHSGENTKLGRDYTLYSISHGFVRFFWDKSIKRQIVSVTPTNSYLKEKIELTATAGL